MLELITIIGVRVVVERNEKTFDAEMNASMNVCKNFPDKKTDLQNNFQYIIQYGTILG